ncbi:hypothetical protein CAP39_02115 [Sphingomonas sp. IBVSS1]|nr:hypothetical protein CAP39_02115 [Sphingomonas sp. IBVSS1]
MKQLATATIIGSIAQIAMVVAGHSVPDVAENFAIGGMGLSALAGWLATRGQVLGLGAGAGQGAAAGAICAAIGIAVSVALGDVPASLLALGTGSSAVTGAIGGVFGRRG